MHFRKLAETFRVPEFLALLADPRWNTGAEGTGRQILALPKTLGRAGNEGRVMPRYNSPYYSRSRWSGWSGFSLRFVGSLVVFAVAALSGAVIGGVGIYLINDAATPPPSAGANINPPALTGSATTSAPARQVAPAVANGRPAATATQPPADNAASSAAIQAQPPVPQPPAAAQPQSPPALTAASPPAPQDDSQTTAQDAATHDAATQAAAPEAGSPRKTAVTKKRAAVTQSAARRTFYDYYDRDDDQQRASATGPDTTVRARRGLSQTQQRIIVRRQDNYGRDDRAEADRRGFPAQPRPAQPFFGFFGDRHYDNGRD
jgi:hypothetical protein